MAQRQGARLHKSCILALYVQSAVSRFGSKRFAWIFHNGTSVVDFFRKQWQTTEGRQAREKRVRERDRERREEEKKRE